jgi:hypothetical protein
MSYDESSISMSSFFGEISIKERRKKKQAHQTQQTQQTKQTQVISVQHSPPQIQSLELLAHTLLLQLLQLPPNLKSIFSEDILQKIIEEDDDNKRPLYYMLIHPDYRTQPLSLRNQTELDKWNEERYVQCDKLSSLFREERKKRYHEKNNWHPCPPSKTHLTKEENEKGWIYHRGRVMYHIPENINKYTCMSNYDYEFLHFIKKVLFNRSNEVCQCTTWKELKNIFEDCWKLKHGDRYTPDLEKALWLISPCANVFPGKQLPRITNPTRKDTYSQYKVVTFCMGDYHLERDNTGICTATNFHELGDMAPIHWHVTPEELQKTMTYFDFIEGTPIGYFDDPYEYYEIEDDHAAFMLGW